MAEVPPRAAASTTAAHFDVDLGSAQQDPDKLTFVIIGAGLTGAKAAETLRAEGFTGRVVLVGEENEPPYKRPPLSKWYLLGSKPGGKVLVHEPAWYDEQRIELRTGVRAEALDRAAHQVLLADGARLRYDKLLLATGSVVRRLLVPGAELPGGSWWLVGGGLAWRWPRRPASSVRR